MKTLNINVGLMLVVYFLTACSSGSGSNKSPAPTPPATEKLYPSFDTSVVTISGNNGTIKAGSSNQIVILVKDQKGNTFALGTKWKLSVTADCTDCQNDVSPVVYLGQDAQGNYKFRFSANESLDHTFYFSFQPSPAYATFATDFPNGPPDSTETYKVVPGYSLCDFGTPDPSLHGLIYKQDDQFAICSAQDLKTVALDDYFLDKSLILVRDIDLTLFYSSNDEFQIGNDCSDPNNCKVFTGSLSGNDKKIIGFKRTNKSLGLFGTIGDMAYVSNLTLVNTNQTSTSGGGALVGSAVERNSLYKVSVSGGQIQGQGIVGGVVGSGEAINLYGVSSSLKVSSNQVAAGLLGTVSTDATDKATVSKSYSTAEISVANVGSGDAYAAGLVGTAEYDVEMTESYFRGKVSSEKMASGLIGKFRGKISKSFSSAQISGERASGLIGDSYLSELYLLPSELSDSFYFNTLSSPTTQVYSIALNCQNLSINHVLNNQQALCETPPPQPDPNAIVSPALSLSDLLTAVSSILSQLSNTDWMKPANDLPTLR